MPKGVGSTIAQNKKAGHDYFCLLYTSFGNYKKLTAIIIDLYDGCLSTGVFDS